MKLKISALIKYFNIYFKYGIIGDFIRIEACSICQLKCADCFQSRNEMGSAGLGYLKYEDFKRFVDSYPEFKEIELSNNGEIFLNPELKDIIEYACKKNIVLSASCGANLNTISDEMAEILVKNRFRAITVSIDGASNDTYQIYRRGGDFNRVIENIKKINYYKDKYGSRLPLLKWQFVIFGHNEHEIAKARNMAGELNMEFFLKFNWNEKYSPVKNIDLIRREMGAASRSEYREKYHKLWKCACGNLWHGPQINWDGKLLGCCANRNGAFGNVFESGLKKCLKSPGYIYAKQMISGRRNARVDIPCFNCFQYKGMLSSGAFFNQYSFIYSLFNPRKKVLQ